MVFCDILIDFSELVLDLIKANSAVQQNACIGGLNQFHSFNA